ncbi:MAG: HEAT repeat domain-containing protein [Candidatus Wallbacteria bacterium]|nr:HEAT repeat domain-containing protein [Candidatus Wallbacteria bacterium]
MDDLKRMLTLTGDPDPQIRRYALSQIEQLADTGDEEEILETLRNATRDPVPIVSHQANRSLTSLLQKSMARPARGPGQLSGSHDVVEGGSFESVPIARLREAGLAVLQPCIEHLHSFATGSNPDIAKKAILALGKIASPTSLPIFRSSVLTASLAEVTALALSELDHPSAIDLLLQAATSNDVLIKQHAVLELGRFSDSRALELLLAHVGFPDPAVRANVATALGEHEDKKAACEPLVRLIADPMVWVALYALKAIGFVKESRATDAVVARFRATTDRHIRSSAIMTLGLMGNLAAVPTVSGALRDPDDRVRANAIEALDKMALAPKEKFQQIKSLLSDANNRVMGNAAVAVQHEDLKLALTTVASMLKNPDKWFRATSAWCLGKIQSPQSAQWLLRLTKTEAEPEVLSVALKSLEHYPSNEVAGQVIGLLEHEEPSIRAHAARLLGLVADTTQLKTVFDAYQKEPEPVVRAALVNAMGRLAGPSDVLYLTECLRDQEPRVQANAIEGIMASAGAGGPDVIPHIRPFIASTNNRLKANAVLALWQQGEVAIVRELEKMLDPANSRQCFSAIYVVGEIGKLLRFLASGPRKPLLLAALKSVSQLLDKGPNTDDALRKLGRGGRSLYVREKAEAVLVEMLADRSEEARHVLTEAAGEMPGEWVWTFLNARLEHPGKPSEARSALLEKDSQLRKDFIGPNLELATIYSSRQETGRLVDAYLKAFEIRLGLLEDQVRISRWLLEKGRVQEAYTTLKFLVSQAPIPPDTHFQIGKMLLFQSRPEEALDHLFRAHVEDPGNAEIGYYYARACAKCGHTGLARELLRRVMEAVKEREAPIYQKAFKLYQGMETEGGGGF